MEVRTLASKEDQLLEAQEEAFDEVCGNGGGNGGSIGPIMWELWKKKTIWLVILCIS